MKKKLLPILLLTVFGLVACGNPKTSSSSEEPSSSSEPTSSSSEITGATVEITNKEDLSAPWVVLESARNVKLNISPAGNISQLVHDKVIKVTSSNPDAIVASGLQLSAVGAGTSTITVTYGDATDTVEVSASVIPEEYWNTDFEVTTIADALELIPNSNDSHEAVYLLGRVSSITNTQYGNGMLVDKANQKSITIYGAYDRSGKIRYDKLSDEQKFVQNDVVVLYGALSNYNGTPEILNARIMQRNSVVFEAAAATGITLDKLEAEIEVGATLKLNETVTPSAAEYTINWTSSNEDVATVSNGTVTGVAAGTATITATISDTVKTSCTIKVVDPSAGAKTLGELNYDSLLNVLPSSAGEETATYTVTQQVPGKQESFKAVFAGTWATATNYTHEDSGHANGCLMSTKVADNVHSDDSCGLYVHTVDVMVRKYFNVEVYATKDMTGEPIEGKAITGSAGVDTFVVKRFVVNSKTWSIKANYNGNSYMFGLQFTVDSEPIPAQEAESISLDKTELVVAKAGTCQVAALVASLVPETAVSTITWTSSNENVATVDEKGNVTGHAVGATTITATANGHTATCAVTVREEAHGETITDPLTTTEAVEIGSSLESGKTTPISYYIRGVVTNVEDDSLAASFNNATFDLDDFYAYRMKPTADVTNYSDFGVGATVTLVCQIKNYDGVIENSNGNIVLITPAA